MRIKIRLPKQARIKLRFPNVVVGGSGVSIRVFNSDETYDITTTTNLELPDSVISNSVEQIAILPATENLTITDSIIYNSEREIKILPATQSAFIEDSKIFESDGITEVVSLPATESFSIPTHKIFNSDGSVRQEDEFNENFTIPVPEPTSIRVFNSNESFDITTDENLELPDSVISNSTGVLVNLPATRPLTITDSKVYKSNGTTQIASIPATQTVNIPDSKIYKSNGTTEVTSLPATESYSIPKHTIFNSDGTVKQTNEFDENFTIPYVPPATGWVRNPDWLPLPEITATDKRFLGLFLVFENQYNQVSFQITNLAANINWGDGTSVISNGAIQTKVYDYAGISGAIKQYYDGRNYKQVIVDVMQNGTNTATIFYPDRNTGINNFSNFNYVDISVSWSTADIQISAQMYFLICERLRVYSWNRTNHTSQFQRMNNLRVMEVPSLFLMTSIIGMNISGDMEAQDIVNNSQTSVTSLGYTNIKKFAKITFNSATSFAIGTRLDLTEIGEINLPLATSFVNGLSGNILINKIGIINAPNAANITQLFNLVRLNREIIFTDASKITNTTSAFAENSLLQKLILPGITVGFSVAQTAMTATGLDEMATSMGNANGSQNVNVTGTPGAATFTRSILTGKGYTVTG
jgi:hypothetical protein